ncbi:signal transduction histidine kinase [Nocardioides albertanoniae]|uniref:histidine kinase n=1 Tax=Nocardioides albertanoniae TaxID=1175486 RepID=A0A543A7P5_9ACTN|nr:sensor histidine kinase [Nocardioides albertanoniae]TQL68608.1 signal transduction histidine kinase [Nocardioides albertanoniae]
MSRIRRHWLPWLVVVAEVVGSLGSNSQADTRGPAVLGALLALLAVLPVVLQRPPAWMPAASAAFAATYFVAGYAEGPIFIAVPAVTFAVGLSLRTRLWIVWAAAGAALVAAGVMLRPNGPHLGGGPGPWGPGAGPAGDLTVWQAFGQVALIAACGAVASALRSRNEARAQRQRRVVSEERVRMAADLHDGVGHGLAVIAMQAGAALHVLDRDPEAARRNLEAIRAESKESLDLLRRQLARMTDAATTAGPRAPEHGLADVRALVERVRTGGLEVSLRIDAPEVTPDAERAVYAVIQEGLTNVLRHAEATRAEVVVQVSGADLVVTVGDDGRGSSTGDGAGMGLAGMRSRVEALGGTLEASPRPRGFRLRASIPLAGSSTGTPQEPA